MPLDSSIYFPQQKRTTKRGLPKNALAHIFSPAKMTSSLTNNKKCQKKTNDTKILRDSKLPTFKLHDLACLWFGRS